MNTQPRSRYTYQLARTWIDECISSHCHPVETIPFQPTRLLYIDLVDGSYIVRLIHSSTASWNGSQAQYVALSYCWGGDQPQKMTTSKYRASNGMVHFDDMPATIQDAITVTFGMGFGFLWVDSLCT